MSDPIPAIVMAGDRGAARAVHGESKVYLDVDGQDGLVLDEVTGRVRSDLEVERAEAKHGRGPLGDLLGRVESEARRQRDTTDRVTELMVDLFRGANPSQSGAEARERTARQLLDEGAEKVLGGLAGEPLVSDSEVSR